MRSWPGLPKRPAVIQCVLNGCTDMLVLMIGHLDPEISWNIPFTSANTRIDLPECTHICCDCQDGFPAAHGCAAAMRPTIAHNGRRFANPQRLRLCLCNRCDQANGFGEGSDSEPKPQTRCYTPCGPPIKTTNGHDSVLTA